MSSSIKITSTDHTFRTGMAAAALLLAAISSVAYGAGTHGGTHGGSNGHSMPDAIGAPGNPEQVTRVIRVSMDDNYYEPEAITVKAGETVRFEIVNAGRLVHEFNIGTTAMHVAHQDEMARMMQSGALQPTRLDHQKMMGMSGNHTMSHDDPNSRLLEPGTSAALVWTFSSAGEVEFACNVPGHYAAGMVGTLRVE